MATSFWVIVDGYLAPGDEFENRAAFRQAQVDWAYFGRRKVEGGIRKLWAFVMVLTYSQWLYFRFFYDARLPSYLAGHVEAGNVFGGSARILSMRQRRGRA